MEFGNLTNSTNDNVLFNYSTASLVTVLLIPIVVAIGIYAEVVTMLIYFSPRLRRVPVNVLLGGLALSDAVMLFFGATVMFPMGLYDYCHMLHSYQVYIAFATKYGYPVAVSAQFASIYILILTTLERYMTVCHPVRAKSVCNVNVAWGGLGVCFGWSLAYNFCRFFEFGIDNQYELFPILKLSNDYNLVYGMYMELVATFCIPFTCLCVFNIKIVLAVNKASNLRKTSASFRRQLRSNIRPVKKYQTTWMMVVVIIVFLLSNSLPFALAIIEVTSKDVILPSLAYFLIDLSNFLVLSNAAFNFLVYIAFSEAYRRQFKRKWTLGFFNYIGRLPSIHHHGRDVAESLSIAAQEIMDTMSSSHMSMK